MKQEIDKTIKNKVFGVDIPTPYEPKRENRFIIEFGPEFNVDKYVPFKTSRPKIKIKKNFWGFNRIKCEPIEIYFRDPIGPSSTDVIYRLIEDIRCSRIKNFSYYLEMIDPTGVVVEKWRIDECTVIDVDFGNLDWNSDSLIIIKMTVQPKQIKLLF